MGEIHASLPHLHAGDVAKGLAGGAAALAATGLVAAGARVLRRRGPRHRDGVGRGIATSDGQLLHTTTYEHEGAPATVVLAHGWTMTSAFWTPTAEALARTGLRAITWDQRGHGRSTIPSSTDAMTLEALGSDLQAVLDAHVPEDHPVVLVGHSMGAMTVLAWAGTQPRRHDVRAAVLANTSAHKVVPDALAALTGTSNAVPHALLRQLVKVQVRVPHTPLNHAIVRRVALSPHAPGTAVAQTYELFRSCPPTVRVGFARQIDLLDLREGARALEVPALVVAGDRDRLTPPSHAEDLVELLPAASLRVLPDTGHQSPLERPAEILDVISGQVRGVLGAPTPLTARPAG